MKQSYFKETREHTEKFHRQYLKIREAPDFTPRHKRLIELIGKKKNVDILDVGCGLGDLMLHLRKRGFMNLVGLDYSRVAVNHTRKLGFKVYLVDLEKEVPKLERKFDFALLGDILEHIEKPREFVERVVTFLKPNGRMIISVPNADWYLNKVLFLFPAFLSLSPAYGVETHIHQFNLTKIKRAFIDFRIKEIRGVSFRYNFSKQKDFGRKVLVILAKILIRLGNIFSDMYPAFFSPHLILIVEKQDV